MPQQPINPSSPKRIWLLRFQHPTPAISLSFLRTVGGFKLDEAYTTFDEQHMCLLLHFSQHAGVSRDDLIEYFQRRTLTAKSVSFVSVDCVSELNTHTGFRLMVTRMQSNIPLLFAWKRSGNKSISLLGIVDLRKTRASKQSNSIIDHLKKVVFGGKCVDYLEKQLPRKTSSSSTGIRRKGDDDITLPIRESKRRLISAPSTQQKSTKSPPMLPQHPSLTPHAAQSQPLLHREPRLPIRVPLSKQPPPPRQYQYVERANDHRWTSGWAM